jgi:hypothetical protein
MVRAFANIALLLVPSPSASTRLAMLLLVAASFWTANGSSQTTPEDGEWGHLRGRFSYDGEPPARKQIKITKDEGLRKEPLFDESLVVGEDHGLANVVVYVTSKDVPVHPDYAATAENDVQLEARELRLEPHIQLIRLSQTLRLQNFDRCSHDIQITPMGDRFVSQVLGVERLEFQFREEQRGPISVTSLIHPWMKSFILPRKNPYMAVTTQDGMFEIRNLPVRELEFAVWHERRGSLQAKPEWSNRGKVKFTIQPGDNNLGEIYVAPKLVESRNR